MDKNELLKNLKYLVNEYISDESKVSSLMEYAESLKAKYILGELERYKCKEYKNEDKEIIKDIYFYFC